MNNYSIAEYIRRYLIFCAGLYVSSFGVALVTKANMGTSPISGIPYVLSLGYPFSLGEFTIVFSLVLVLLQILILRSSFQKASLLQIPISVLFGYFIDVSMHLLKSFRPEHYLFSCGSLILGCMILGFGVYLEVIADVILLPGEALVKAVITLTRTEFGLTKICFDTTLVVIGIVLSFLLFGELHGIREGTIVAALTTGFFAKLFLKYFLPFTRLLLDQKAVDCELPEEC